MRLGIIAEDKSDVDVLSAITRRLLGGTNVGIKQFVGKGCGKLRRKCRPWAENLVRRGCAWIVVLHDLDDNQEDELRRKLTSSLDGIKAVASVVLIPVREIEAWLMYDARAIAVAMREHSQPRLPANPEALDDPKEELGRIIKKAYGKQYLHTVHNARIAQALDPKRLSRARSFGPHPRFVEAMKQPSRAAKRARSA